MNSESRWERRIQQLKQYRQETGDCCVPENYSKNKPLAKWVAKQRLRYKLRKQGKEVKLTNEDIAELEGIGFVWDVERSSKPKQKNITSRDLQWKKRVAELRDYQKENGHCQVPKICQSNMKIPSRDVQWNKRVSQLLEFRNENGHCQVPFRYEANKQLGYWVKQLRGHYTKRQQGEKTPLTDARIAELESIGFLWKIREAPDALWKKRVEELIEFRNEHGHCCVPTFYPGNMKLGRWVNNTRQRYTKQQQGKKSPLKKTPLTDARIAELESIGFVWKVREGRDNAPGEKALGKYVIELTA